MQHASIDGVEGSTHLAVRRVEWVGRLLDESIRVPGTSFRVGLDPILGIVPIAGDAIATAFSLYILLEAARLGVDARTLLRMVAHVAVDAVVGSIPVLGTLFDAVWKANTWNARILASHVEADGSVPS
ncbi:MAG: DUF4112 domain-containing protein [archaeon]